MRNEGLRNNEERDQEAFFKKEIADPGEKDTSPQEAVCSRRKNFYFFLDIGDDFCYPFYLNLPERIENPKY